MYQVRLADIFWHHVATSLLDLLRFTHNSDTSAATGCAWLHYVHVFEVAHFSVDQPSLVVLWEYVGRWADVKRLAMKTFHTLHIPPHVVLPSNCPWASKVINVLLTVHVFQSALLEETCPDHVPAWTSHVFETCHLQRVDHTVVGVRTIGDFETWSFVRLQLVLGKLYDSRVVLGEISLLPKERWVGEEDVWIPGREWALDESYNLIGWTSQILISECMLTLLVC